MSKTEINTALDLGDQNRKKREKLWTIDSSYLLVKNHFEDDDELQNYLIFQPVFKYFTTATNSDMIIDLSIESIKPPATSNNSLNPGLNYINNAKIQVQFDGSCLK